MGMDALSLAGDSLALVTVVIAVRQRLRLKLWLGARRRRCGVAGLGTAGFPGVLSCIREGVAGALEEADCSSGGSTSRAVEGEFTSEAAPMEDPSEGAADARRMVRDFGGSTPGGESVNPCGGGPAPALRLPSPALSDLLSFWPLAASAMSATNAIVYHEYLYPLTVGGLSVSLLIARSRSGMHLDVARWS